MMRAVEGREGPRGRAGYRAFQACAKALKKGVPAMYEGW